MPVLTEEEEQSFREPSTKDVVPNFVALYWDMVALFDKQPIQVIGETGSLKINRGLKSIFWP